MDTKRQTRISKFLSKHLRHEPEGLGLTLAPGGWVAVNDLLAACNDRGVTLTLTELQFIVAQCNKQRFAFDETGTCIRANQGHSVEVDLQLTPKRPPALLYHGTPEQFVPIIQRDGLNKMERHHVHLSPDIATAQRVGSRRGRSRIFAIDAAKMYENGIEFFCSANGVWLVDSVSPQYLRLLDEST